MSLLVSLPAILAILATVAYGDELQITPKTPDEFLSYMQARGFMQIDEIIDEKSCISFKFYITHDSTQKCLRHRCTDNVVLSDFDCKLWNQVKRILKNQNCKDAFSVRIQCKLFDGVKPANRHTVFKKRRHHGKI
uniref:Secreted protein n=1 Tax=Caenorhabditis tropicalis TaxID=1561998 RepID=A0A1I7TRU2_9PELO